MTDREHSGQPQMRSILVRLLTLVLAVSPALTGARDFGPGGAGIQLAAGSPLAQAPTPQRHWLVGTWQGTVRGLPSDRGNERTLTVDAVAADGTVRGGWTSDPQRTLGRNAKIKLEGDTVHVRTQENHTVTLKRHGDGRLEGSFVSTGGANRSYPVELTRR